MRKVKVSKIIILVIGVLVALWLFSNKSYAGSIGVSSSATTVEPGNSFTVTVKGNNATGKVTLKVSNGTLSQSSVWVENNSVSVTVTAGSEGKTTVTATVADVVDSSTAATVGGSSSASVTVKKNTPAPTPTTPTTPTTPNNNGSSSNTKKDTKKDPKAETKKAENKVADPVQEQPVASPFGLGVLGIHGLNEVEEQVEVLLDKEFAIDVYEYTAEVGAEVKKVILNIDSNEYAQFVTITGLEEDLKPGENIITLKMVKEGEEEKTYTIKVIKPIEEVKQEDVVETSANAAEEKKETTITMPVLWFVLLEVLVVLFSSVITGLIVRYVVKKKTRSVI